MPSYEETPQVVYATYVFCILWIYGWLGLCILVGILTLIDKIKKREYKWKKKEIIDETKEKEDESKEIATIEKTGISKLVKISPVDVDNSLSQIWGFDTTGFISEVNKNVSLSTTKFGMLARLPIVCKGAQCHFIDTCTVDPANLIPGQRCPIEVGVIIARYTQYCKHFGINIENNIVADEDIIDATLIKDLVVIEMQQMRCESKIALSGDFHG